MPEIKPGEKTLEGTLEDHHYPSDVDNMVRNDTPFEGTENSLPKENPIPGADGTLPSSIITKIKG